MGKGLSGTIKLGGEKEFRDALRSISQQLRETGSELNAISSGFEASDKSERAIADTTSRYSGVLEKQRSAYNQLQSVLNGLSAEYEKNKVKLNDLNTKRDSEKQKLDNIKKTLGESSKEYTSQAKVVADLDKEIDSLTKEQTKNESTMSRTRTQMNNVEAAANKTAKEIGKLGEETEDTGKKADEAANGGFTVFKGMLANLASSAVTAAINAVKKLGEAVVNVGKQAVENYAQYEQLVGGVETLFGESSKIVEDYANNAYKTAGLSANQYMETVTSFSASLLQSLGGDTEKAAQVGDMAVTDMADNANKMGTSIESIQNAYQGFAKQNYTINLMSAA